MTVARREIVRMAGLVLAAGVVVSGLRSAPRIDLAIIVHGAIQAALVMAIAGPIAGMIYWLGGSDERAAVRAARLWGLTSVIVLLLIQLAGVTLLSRFAASPGGG